MRLATCILACLWGVILAWPVAAQETDPIPSTLTLPGPKTVEPEPSPLPPVLPGSAIASRLDLLTIDYYSPRANVAYQTAPGVGYRESFTTLGGWLPFCQSGEDLCFADVRLFLSDPGFFGANIGLGYRFYDDFRNRVWGVNTYYDYRDTGNNGFNQWGIGFESLGERLDYRLNFYLPGGGRRLAAESFLSSTQSSQSITSPFYQGNNLLFDLTRQEVTTVDRRRRFESAMGGLDFEIGGPPLAFFENRFASYLGFYHFQGSAVQQAWGVRGRFEFNLADFFVLNLSVSNDQVFDTNVVFSAAFYFPAPASKECRARLDGRKRLDEPIIRNSYIVVGRSESLDRTVSTRTLRSQEIARDPQTGEPIIFMHVDSNAATAGNGTFEQPFQTLAALQAASQPGNTLVVHSGSVLAEAIVLKDNQRFLGDGPNVPMFTNTQFGVVQLPRTNNDPNPPVITGAGAPRVTLANNNEVAGFVFGSVDGSQTVTTAIQGTGIDNFNINHNLAFYTNRAISLSEVTGNGLIDIAFFSGTVANEAVRVDNSGTTQLNLVVTNLQVQNISTPGAIVLNTSGNATMNAVVAGNRTSGSTFGLDVRTSDSSVMTLIANANLFQNHSTRGANLLSDGSSSLTARVSNNQFLNNTDRGLFIDQQSVTTTNVYGVQNNIFSGNGAVGAEIANQNGTLGLRLTGNSSDTNYLLNQISGTFNAEAGFSTQTTGTVNTNGTINTIPAGSLIIP